jgi:type IV pilus assembly protein PilM
LAFFKTKDRVLGIDISPSAVKLIELSRSGIRYTVEAMAVEPLPEGAVHDRNPADTEKVGTAIKRAVKTSSTRLRKAAVAVPTSSVITRTISMPAEFSEAEIEANIQLDASQYIPFPLEEIHLDFQVIPESQTPGTQNVMLVASRQENVDLRQEALEEAGLKAAIVDVEAYSLENAFRFLEQALPKQISNSEANKLTALVDIGASISTLYILRGDRVVFTREQNFGTDQLTTTIMTTYDLPRERAELAKRSNELPDGYQVDILNPFLKSTALQIEQALQFFFSSDQYSSGQLNIENLILVGGGAMTPGLDEIVKEHLSVPTAIGNPFNQMGNAARINRASLMRDAPLFAIACGLALRSYE